MYPSYTYSLGLYDCSSKQIRDTLIVVKTPHWPRENVKPRFRIINVTECSTHLNLFRNLLLFLIELNFCVLHFYFFGQLKFRLKLIKNRRRRRRRRNKEPTTIAIANTKRYDNNFFISLLLSVKLAFSLWFYVWNYGWQFSDRMNLCKIKWKCFHLCVKISDSRWCMRQILFSNCSAILSF